MTEQTAECDVYEPPALVEAGEFAEVTMGAHQDGTCDGTGPTYYRS
ncbi:lasso RiPP family leader peptide-containing protein [Streptomyces sp. NRRL F-5755]|nr:lasso RiPP family leader peptide-containing protein [Streptomyces sp. NRRL F-5755]